MTEHHYTAVDAALTNIDPDEIIFPLGETERQANEKDWTKLIIKKMRSKSELRIYHKENNNG